MFTEGKDPGFFKIRNKGYKTGQRLYNVYKRIGYGKQEVEYTQKGTNKKTNKTLFYPIYTLVTPRGGKYFNQQVIYDFNLDQTSKNILLDTTKDNSKYYYNQLTKELQNQSTLYETFITDFIAPFGKSKKSLI